MAATLTETILQGPLTGDMRSSTFHPEQWKSDIEEINLRTARNAPLLALLESVPTRNAEDIFYNWSVQPWAKMRGTVLDAYTDILTTAYVSGGVDGTTIYLAMSAADSKQIVKENLLLVMNMSTNAYVKLWVTSVVTLGDTTSYAVCRLLQTDTNLVLAASSLQFVMAGSAAPEFGGLPDVLYSEPIWFRNNVQVHTAAWDLSNIERKRLDRVQPGIKERKMTQAYKRLRRGMEMTFRYGTYATISGGGANNKDVYMTRGIIDAIINMTSLGTGNGSYSEANVFDWRTDTEFAGQTWNQGGLKWLRKKNLLISLFGEGNRKDVLASSNAVLAITEAVEDATYYHITSQDTEFGLIIHRLIMAGGQVWDIIEDPIFSENPMFQNCALAMEPGALYKWVFQPMKEIDGAEQADGHLYLAGLKGGWEEISGLGWDNLANFGLFLGVGDVNTA